MSLNVLQVLFLLVTLDFGFSDQNYDTSWSPYGDRIIYNRGLQSLFTCPLHELARDTDLCDVSVPWGRRPKLLVWRNAGNFSAGFVNFRHYFQDASEERCSTAEYYSVPRCKYDVIHKCLLNQYQGLLPDLDRLREGMKFLCDNIFQQNPACLYRLLPDFERCILHEGFEHPEQIYTHTLVQNTCRSHEYAVSCLLTSLAPCGEQAESFYSQAMDYVKPVVCGSERSLVSLVLMNIGVMLNLL